ncbi:hypothetical protein ACMT9U_03460 [Clavibacter sp. Sh2036]|uniref:hypothetical protein n=1 Tax=Clavibacter sp. Sh2036 TaxID=3397677 RepID=UPI0039DFA3D3
MDDAQKIEFYAALRALDRMVGHLHSHGISVDANMSGALDSWWDELRRDTRTTTLDEVDEQIEHLVVDEQDASTQQICYNFFLYVLSDVIISLREELNFSQVFASVEECCFYQAGESMLESNVRAIVPVEAEIAELQAHPDHVNEMLAQGKDRTYAAAVGDWTTVDR